MYCKDFEYAGERLSAYGMIIGSLNGSTGSETVSSGADISFTQIKPSRRNDFHLYSSTYESPYTTTFQIYKNPCQKNSRNGLYLSFNEISAIQKWLCRKNQYQKFKIDQAEYRNVYWNAIFQVKQILLSGKPVGLELTMYTDAPYAYAEDIRLEFHCNAWEPFSIYDASDEEGSIYPSLEITCLDSPETEDVYTFTLTNSRDNHITQVKGCKSGETILINGKTLTISSSDATHISLSKDFNYYFPRLINTYENHKNIFKANKNCLIKLSYSPIKKVGL